jgi:hypothetical protein
MIQSRQDGSLPQELLAGLLHHLGRERAVVLDFFKRAQTPLQPQVVSQINTSHSPVTDDAADSVSPTQYFTCF